MQLRIGTTRTHTYHNKIAQQKKIAKGSQLAAFKKIGCEKQKICSNTNFSLQFKGNLKQITLQTTLISLSPTWKAKKKWTDLKASSNSIQPKHFGLYKTLSNQIQKWLFALIWCKSTFFDILFIIVKYLKLLISCSFRCLFMLECHTFEIIGVT